jgi:hypothetical protein
VVAGGGEASRGGAGAFLGLPGRRGGGCTGGTCSAGTGWDWSSAGRGVAFREPRPKGGASANQESACQWRC